MRLAVPIRWRLAAVSTLVAGVLLGGAGLIFLTTLRSGLERSVDDSLRARATSLAAQLTSAGTPRSGVSFTVDDDSFGQVLSPGGTVVTETPQRLPGPVLTAAQVATVTNGRRSFDVHPPDESHRVLPKGLRVYARPLPGGRVLAVAVSRDVVDEAVERAGKQLLVLGGIAIVVAGAGSWLLAGTALRPVERLRRQAAELEAHDPGADLEVPRSRDEVQRLAITLNGMLGRLRDALDRERAFVADAGHELRTPLTVLRGELELAGRPGRGITELRDTVTIAAEETERLIGLAENLLVLARQEGTGDPLDQRFEVMAVVHAAAAPTAGGQLDVSVAGPAQLRARGDEDAIRRVVVNLVGNARRFARRAITVTVQADGRDVRLSVEDDGPGFAPDFLPHAFERFRRGDAPRTRTVDGSDGSGLGLSIVQAIAHAHHGAATAANRSPAPGAVVTVTWPGAPSTTGTDPFT